VNTPFRMTRDQQDKKECTIKNQETVSGTEPQPTTETNHVLDVKSYKISIV